MSRGRATTSDLIKLWVIDVIIIAGAVYAGNQQHGAAICGVSTTDPQGGVFSCFIGSLARMLFPWLVGGAVIIGAMTLILTIVHMFRRRFVR
jgi:hypothetical protein